jgi:hypothetical protein
VRLLLAVMILYGRSHGEYFALPSLSGVQLIRSGHVIVM